MELILEIGLLVGLILLANVVARQGGERPLRWFERLLLGLNLPLFFFGIFFVLTPDERLAQMSTDTGELLFPMVTDPLSMGIILQVTAVWGVIFSFRSTRRGLARLLPIEPGSAVHALALVCVGWLVGSTLVQVTQSSLTQLVEAVGEITPSALILQGSLFTLVGVLGVGLGLRRSLGQTRRRLLLEPLTPRQIPVGLAWIFSLILIQTLLSAVWLLVDPDQARLVNDLNLELQTGLDTVWAWLILAITAGVGEEILFRGALQPVLGLWVTSILFAMVHIQYGFFTPATLALLIIGLVLGSLRQRYHTTMAIFVHTGYNFFLGLAALAGMGA